MADLFSLLGQASQSLSAHRTASATASHNLQNSATAGYARQRAELGAVTQAQLSGGAWLGRGATVLGISQARSRFIEGQLPELFGRAASGSAEAGVLRDVHALDLEGPLSPATALSAFTASLTELSQNPGNRSLREAALASARGLQTAFGRTAQSLDAARRAVDGQLTAHLPEVNALAQEVARLNREVRTAAAQGGAPNDLMDARQRAQDRLSELTGATAVPNAEGDVQLRLPSGGALVAGDVAHSLEALPDLANGGHLQLSVRTASGALQAAAPGGTLGGLLAARDGALRTAQGSLDAVAFDFAQAMNAAHAAGVGLDGAPGGPLFDAGATAEGAAARFRVHPQVAGNPDRLATAVGAGTLPGGADGVLGLLSAAQGALASGLPAGQALSQLTSAFGASARHAQAVASHEGLLLDQTLAARESVSGVSVDEELLNLTRSQRAYEAVLKVISTADEMLDALMRLKG